MLVKDGDKMVKLRKRNISLLLGGLFLLVGCGDAAMVDDETQMNVGQFITVFDKKVNYRCGNQEKSLSESGEFRCPSFPISFYIDNVKLGEISSIHADGYVFPQDIMLFDETNGNFSSDGRI